MLASGSLSASLMVLFVYTYPAKSWSTCRKFHQTLMSLAAYFTNLGLGCRGFASFTSWRRDVRSLYFILSRYLSWPESSQKIMNHKQVIYGHWWSFIYDRSFERTEPWPYPAAIAYHPASQFRNQSRAQRSVGVDRATIHLWQWLDSSLIDI